MTKKHSIAIAAAFKTKLDDLKINTYLSPDASDAAQVAVMYCARVIADIAADENPRFDRKRFFAACGF